MRVADYIWKTLADFGIKHVFLVTGGGAMHLNDALKKESRINPICCHNESGCSIAAEGYYKASGKISAVSVTTGPGGTNAITGVYGAWVDSIPMIVISGQVKYSTTIDSCKNLKLRQLGDQEINIIDIVKPITKYAKSIIDPKEIKRELNHALKIALSGRFGPVWLDIPLNVQGFIIDENQLISDNDDSNDDTEIDLNNFYENFKKSKRPVVIAGHGIELSGSKQDFLRLVNKLKIPVLSTFNGLNVIPTTNEYQFGRIGTIGNRYSNMILQSSDFIICIGTRNNIRQVSYNWENFGKNATIVAVDIDKNELKKPTIKIDYPINCDARKFIDFLLNKNSTNDYTKWLDWCKERRSKFDPMKEYDVSDKNGINPYYLMRELTIRCKKETNIVAGNGTACVALMQTGVFTEKHRVVQNSGCAAMGYDIPAALGACISNGEMTVCLAGDGSIMMNIQELQTLITQKCNIKIFLLDNNGYMSIIQTQTNLFNSNFIGCNKDSGIDFPDFSNVAKAFGYKYSYIQTNKKLVDEINDTLYDGIPQIYHIKINTKQFFSPKLSAKRLEDGTMVSPTLEDMFPFLDKSVLHENMIYEN